MSGRDEHGYDAFISYSHAGDGKLAPALQAGIEKFAKPWYRIRALKVFRDQTSLSANPRLWPSIETALARSSWFVLLASPEAAASPWVAKEIQWWRKHRSVDRLLIVLTGGTLRWDDAVGDFESQNSTALPAVLRGAFTEQPRWVDASWDDDAALASRVNPHLQDVVADVASAIRGVPKDELVGLHVSEHRRTMRWVAGATSGLALLLVVSIIASVLALNQRDTAIEQRNAATARQLAAVSTSELATNLDVAQLLAANAYRMDANPQTRAALLQAVTFSPHLVRYLPAGAEVSELAGSGDGHTVVAGLRDGKVRRWNLVDSTSKEIFALPAEVASLAVSHDGTVVLASGGSVAVLWKADRQPAEIALPPDQHAGPVAVSPSGRTAFVAARQPVFEGRQSVVVVDVESGATSVTHEVRDMPAVSSLASIGEDEIFLLDGGYGFWQRLRVRDGALVIGSRAYFGVRNYAFGTSGHGEWFSYTNGAPWIPVWRTDRPSDPENPEFAAYAPISYPESLTLSPAGTHLAVADSGVIHVSQVARLDAPRDPAIQLVGNGSINPDGVRFFGDGSRLISASRDKIALWDVGQLDRLARVARVSVRRSCRACPPPSVRVSPLGDQIAIVDGNGESATLVAPNDTSRPAVNMPTHLFRYQYGLPVWDAASRYVVLPISPPSGASRVSAPVGLPAMVRAWPAGEGSDVVVAAAPASDGKTAILVNTFGLIRIHDAETGTLRKTIPGPAELAGEANALQTNTGSAAVDSISDLVALVIKGSVRLVDVATGNIVETIPGNDAASIAFSGRRLLVQRKSGTLEVWNDRGSTKEREIAGDNSYGWAVPVGNQQGTVVARLRSNGSIVLADLDNGAIIATFPPGPGSPGRKTGIGFSPAGDRLITVIEGGDQADGLLVVRDLSADALVRTACATAGRALTAAEWHAFVGSAAPEDLGCR